MVRNAVKCCEIADRCYGRGASNSFGIDPSHFLVALNNPNLDIDKIKVQRDYSYHEQGA